MKEKIKELTINMDKKASAHDLNKATASLGKLTYS